jgi:hypothetical protein
MKRVVGIWMAFPGSRATSAQPLAPGAWSRGYIGFVIIRDTRHLQAPAPPCSADKRNYRAYTGTKLFTAPLKKAALIVQAIRIACGFDA